MTVLRGNVRHLFVVCTFLADFHALLLARSGAHTNMDRRRDSPRFDGDDCLLGQVQADRQDWLSDVYVSGPCRGHLVHELQLGAHACHDDQPRIWHSQVA